MVPQKTVCFSAWPSCSPDAQKIHVQSSSSFALIFGNHFHTNKSSDQALGVPFRNHGDNNGEEDEDAEMTRCGS